MQISKPCLRPSAGSAGNDLKLSPKQNLLKEFNVFLFYVDKTDRVCKNGLIMLNLHLGENVLLKTVSLFEDHHLGADIHIFVYLLHVFIAQRYAAVGPVDAGIDKDSAAFGHTVDAYLTSYGGRGGYLAQLFIALKLIPAFFGRIVYPEKFVPKWMRIFGPDVKCAFGGAFVSLAFLVIYGVLPKDALVLFQYGFVDLESECVLGLVDIDHHLTAVEVQRLDLLVDGHRRSVGM